ncbi:hypothetical protein [Chitinophaga sp. sic0106]|uniref:DUF6928 family protein n=1 Tax=Chitinophaga sp. sic0106 TaxID=2854785 RepID=UPI001C44B93F|nr:hypothetical protein [Chitinophaga sp. sic0106]MBV7530518.1 hypothetical protein [Chitinophaga sp. sic0106]
MGWKVFTIIISPSSNIEFDHLLGQLNLPDLQPAAEDSMNRAIYPDQGKIYIGHVQNCLVITDFYLPEINLTSEISPMEAILIQEFPNAEICTLVLHSTVNFWGYSIIQNGIKVRARAGSADTGTTLDFGTALQEELPLLEKSSIDEDGNRLYIIDGETYMEDQVGENLVFDVASRYFGAPLDRLEEEVFFGATMKGFSYFIPQKQRIRVVAKPMFVSNPWWKFW